MATDAAKGKVALSPMKEHLTRTTKQLVTEIGAKYVRASKIFCEKAPGRITKLEKFLVELENVQGIENVRL